MICWRCRRKEKCKLFTKNPEIRVAECTNFIWTMKNIGKVIIESIHICKHGKHFEESEE